MPKVLKFEQRGDEIWARLDLKDTSSPVLLYTEKELHDLRHSDQLQLLNGLAALVSYPDLLDYVLHEHDTRRP